jgi:hypothetical protein
MSMYNQYRFTFDTTIPLQYYYIFISYLIDLLEAPGSFIMGCDSKHYFQVKSLMAAQDEVLEIRQCS